jgi:superfamily II DNA helicase RecQ
VPWLSNEVKRPASPPSGSSHDRTLVAVAAAAPRDEASLLAVPGIGPALLRRFGDASLDLGRGARGRTSVGR